MGSTQLHFSYPFLPHPYSLISPKIPLFFSVYTQKVVINFFPLKVVFNFTPLKNLLWDWHTCCSRKVKRRNWICSFSHSFWLVGGVFTWHGHASGEKAESKGVSSPSASLRSGGSEGLLITQTGMFYSLFTTALVMTLPLSLALSFSLSPLFFFKQQKGNQKESMLREL